MNFVSLQPGEFVLAKRAAASLVIALASAQDKQAEVSAALARKALESISAKYAARAGAFWEAANKDALALLIPVVQNNPGKSPAQIMARPDVLEVVTAPYKEAAAAAAKALREASDEAAADTIKRIRSEFKLSGHEWAGADISDTLVNQFIKDLDANAKAMQARYKAAMKDRETFAVKAQTIASDAARRARYSTSGAVGDTATATRTDAFAKAGLNMMWLSRLDVLTCSVCRDLHGTVIAPGGEFPHGLLPVYGGFLGGPPRHPNCRCVLVGTKKAIS